jgi:hypothetical protein
MAAGETVTVFTIVSPGVTTVKVTVAVPDLEVSTVEVAFTVKVAAVSPAATVKSALPAFWVNVVPATWFPTSVQVTAWLTPSDPVTVAVNCALVPFGTDMVGGETVTVSTTTSGVGGVPPPPPPPVGCRQAGHKTERPIKITGISTGGSLFFASCNLCHPKNLTIKISLNYFFIECI